MTSSGIESFRQNQQPLDSDPRALVCQACWDSCFSTEDFRALCKSPDSKEVVNYARAKAENHSSASAGCAWCAFIGDLGEQSEETVPPEFREDSDTLLVQLRTGVFHEHFTPRGNNRFTVSVNGVLNHLTAFTKESNLASSIVTARPVLINVASESAFESIHHWLKKCASHPKCVLPSVSRLPSRVIETKPTGRSNLLRLLETQGKQGRYAALSYCWGENQVGLTTSQNLSQRLFSLDVTELSKTAQEAIQVIDRLGIRYLWVDAICIIQDSEEDKIKEISRMCDIYQRAYITIIAANAAHSDEGFLQTRQLPGRAIEIPFWGSNSRPGSASVRPEGWYSDDTEPINTRGWTLQERLLSPRLIIYASHTIQLQCQYETVNLGDSLNIPSGLETWRIPSTIHDPSFHESGRTLADIVGEWINVVSLYSTRQLKYPGDRLLALAGLAQVFAPAFQSGYLAGLWDGPSLLPLLLWQPTDYAGSSPKAYVAPTWSWASRPTGVSYRSSQLSQAIAPHEVEVLSATTRLENPSLPFGKVLGGRIVLNAHVLTAEFIAPHGVRIDGMIHEPPRPALPQSGIYSSDFVMPDYSFDVHFDGKSPRQGVQVLCLALVSRSYEYDGILYTVIDGLLIEPAAQGGLTQEFQRIGCFFGATREELARSEEKEVVLI